LRPGLHFPNWFKTHPLSLRRRCYFSVAEAVEMDRRFEEARQEILSLHNINTCAQTN